jgi:hypothetical protein
MKSLVLRNAVFVPVVFLDDLVKVHVELGHLLFIVTFVFLDVLYHIVSHYVFVVYNGVDHLVSINVE